MPSKSPSQHKLMAAVAHNPAFAKKVGIPTKVGKEFVSADKKMDKGGNVNDAGNYTKPGMRKALFNKIKAGSKGGDPGEWSARKAQLLAVQYKKAGGGYK